MRVLSPSSRDKLVLKPFQAATEAGFWPGFCACFVHHHLVSARRGREPRRPRGVAVERVGVHVGSLGPRDRSELLVDAHPPEELLVVAKRLEHGPPQLGPMAAERSLRLDVLVGPEEVGRVVGALELDQPLGVSRAIGLAHPVGGRGTSSGDVAFCVRILPGPDRVDVDVVGGIALAEGRLVLSNAAQRPAELEDDAVGLGRGDRRCVLDERVDSIIGKRRQVDRPGPRRMPRAEAPGVRLARTNKESSAKRALVS
jgi:hypothetical protein